MNSFFADTLILARSTLKIYTKCFVFSLKASLSSWRSILVQVAGLILLSVLTRVILGVFAGGGLIPSLILGLVLAYFLTLYFCLIRYAVESENITMEALKHDSSNLFSSVISALFMLFVVRFTLDFLKIDFLTAAAGILMAVFLNPLPEVIYQRGGGMAETFSESFEFIKDNFVEWFFIPFLLLLFFYGPSPRSFFEVLSMNPLYQIEMLIFGLSGFALSPTQYFMLFLILIIMYFVMVFRGVLFKELRLGRRARLYREKQ